MSSDSISIFVVVEEKLSLAVSNDLMKLLDGPRFLFVRHVKLVPKVSVIHAEKFLSMNVAPHFPPSHD